MWSIKYGNNRKPWYAIPILHSLVILHAIAKSWKTESTSRTGSRFSKKRARPLTGPAFKIKINKCKKANAPFCHKWCGGINFAGKWPKNLLDGLNVYSLWEYKEVPQERSIYRTISSHVAGNEAHPPSCPHSKHLDKDRIHQWTPSLTEQNNCQ